MLINNTAIVLVLRDNGARATVDPVHDREGEATAELNVDYYSWVHPSSIWCLSDDTGTILDLFDGYDGGCWCGYLLLRHGYLVELMICVL